LAKDGTYYIRGKAFYAKVLGRPVPNFGKDGFEWTIELEPNKEGKALLKDLGVDDRISKGEKGNRILFRQKEKRLDGTPNRPITVVDDNNHPWPQDKLIGNESIVDLKFNYKDYGKGKKAGLYPQGIRILEHVPYERVEFAPLKEDDEFFRRDDDPAPDFRNDFDIPEDDDDIA